MLSEPDMLLHILIIKFYLYNCEMVCEFLDKDYTRALLEVHGFWVSKNKLRLSELMKLYFSST